MPNASHLSKIAIVFSTLVCVTGGATWGCQAVLGIGADAKLGPDSGTGSSDAAATDAVATDAAAEAETPVAACALPTGGDAFVRIGNFVPNLERYEVCLTPATGGTATGVFASLTGACPTGIQYKDLTAPIPAKSGTYSAKLVKASKGCSDPGVASLSSVAIDPTTTTTIAAFGDGNTTFQLAALHENVPTGSNPSNVRLFNASADGPALDFGLAKGNALPTKLLGPFFTNIVFGTTSPPGTGAGGPIDAQGYAQLAVSGATISLAAAKTTTTDAVLVTNAKLVGRQGYTFYAIGKHTDARFPYEIEVCNETQSDGIYALCANATPTNLVLDVFNTQLSGDFGPLEQLRGPALPAEIAKLTSDVACITDVVLDSDKKAIADAAKAHFPYSYWVATTEASAINDPTDLGGATKTEPAGPACQTTDVALFNTMMDCVTTNCAEDPSKPSSPLKWGATDCLATNCTGPIAALIYTGNDKNCWDCGLTQFFGRAPLDATRTTCTTGTQYRHYAAGGSNSVLVLSRFPITAPESYVLPSTDFRIGMLRAPITTDTGAKLDIYCTDLTTPATGATRPYTGLWGASATGPETDDAKEWSNELLLQVKKAAAWAKARTAASGAKGLLAGDFYAGPDIPPALTGVQVDAYNALTSVWPVAQAPNYTPACTFCSDNPITTPPGTGGADSGSSAGANTWTSFATLVNMAITEVVSNEVILKAPVLTYTTYKVPLSNYYGMRTTVRVRP